MTIEDILKQHFPDELKRFRHSPWDYRVFGPMSIEDEAAFTVHLHVGRTKRRLSFTFNVVVTEAKVEQTHINSPKFQS